MQGEIFFPNLDFVIVIIKFFNTNLQLVFNLVKVRHGLGVFLHNGSALNGYTLAVVGKSKCNYVIFEHNNRSRRTALRRIITVQTVAPCARSVPIK